jgi:hypothetical protein
MSASDLERAVTNALLVLTECLPGKTYLYVPFLSAALAWALERDAVWRESIFGWQIWPDPEYIKTKSDDFVHDFFNSRPRLARAYRRELEGGDLTRLRRAFRLLYPILGLQDPFLTELFHEELSTGDYPAVVREFEGRVAQAKADIAALRDRDRLLSGLRTFGLEALSLGRETLLRTDVRNALRMIVKERLKESHD